MFTEFTPSLAGELVPPRRLKTPPPCRVPMNMKDAPLNKDADQVTIRTIG